MNTQSDRPYKLEVQNTSNSFEVLKLILTYIAGNEIFS
jgi:hypothetical protein